MFLLASGNKVGWCGSVAKFACSPQGTHCKHKCSKHGTRGAKFALQQGVLPTELLSFVLQNATPWCCFCSFVDGCLWQTPVVNVLVHGGGELFVPMAVCFALVWKSGTPWCDFCVLWANFKALAKACGWGVLAKCNKKATPWWQKRIFCFAVVWQNGGNGSFGCHCKNTHTGWAFSPFRTWVVGCRLGAGGRFFLPPCRCCIGFVGQFARHLGQVARHCDALAPRWACRLWKTCKFQK